VADNEVAMQLFRIAREAVASAIEHGAATQVTIQIGFRGDVLVLTVADNGGKAGRSCRTSKEAVLRMMRHRARNIGAVLTMTKRPMGGTLVRCTCGGDRAA
jgi:signal transduction histidine kinase